MAEDKFLNAVSDIKKFETKGAKIDILSDGKLLPSAIGYRAGKGYDPVVAIKTSDLDIRTITGFKNNSPQGEKIVSNEKDKFVLISCWPKQD